MAACLAQGLGLCNSSIHGPPGVVTTSVQRGWLVTKGARRPHTGRGRAYGWSRLVDMAGSGKARSAVPAEEAGPLSVGGQWPLALKFS